MAWLLFFISFILLGYHPIAESDVFMYLALARDFFARGHFAPTDPFILGISGAEWDVLHEWVSYFLFYGAYVLAGYAGVSLFKILIAAIAWAPAVWALGRQRLWESSWHFALFFTGFLAFSLRYTERASLIADALLALVTAVVLSDARASSEQSSSHSTAWGRISGKCRWTLPLIFLVWINVHASFPKGFLICGAWLLSALLTRDGAVFRQRLGPVVAGAAVLFLNPLGLEGVTYPFRFLGFKNHLLESTNHEWSHSFTPELFQFHEVWFFYVFLILAITHIISGIQRRRAVRPWLSIFLTLIFVYFGLSANRFISSAVLGLLLIALDLDSPTKGFPRLGAKLSLVASATLLALIVTGTYRFIGFPVQLRSGVDERIFPTENMQRLRTDTSTGTVWNSFYFGCYLAWALEQKKTIAIHGFATDMRYFLRFYSPIVADRARFDETAERMNLRAFLLMKQSTAIPFFDLMRNHPQWRFAGEDEASLLFLRRSP